MSATAAPAIDAESLRRWLGDGEEIALLDVREHGQYGEGHPFFAVHAPYSRLEAEVQRLVPRRGTRAVLLDGGSDSSLAHRAARRLAAAGYRDVHVLDGGAAAWARAGHALFKGVNVPSKTFGERVEHAFDVPRITAADLADRRSRGEPLVLFDGRTLDEHRRMTIPGALPIPNGELALRWHELVPDATTTVVVHCAGRTRSIVGAQILRDLDVPNPVVALQNGTQGWALAGMELERGSPRCLPDLPGAAALQATRSAAAALARRVGAPALTGSAAQDWVDDTARTTYVFDVRTPAEFAAGSLPHARSAPGGQLLQATDLHIGVRSARVLLIDDDGVRAPVVAAWLRRLGHDAATVEGGVGARLRLAAPNVDLPRLPRAAGGRELAAGPAALDLRPSMTYRAGHAAAARWSNRPRVVADARASATTAQPLLLIADDDVVARLAALDLREAGWSEVFWTRQADVEAVGWPQDVTPALPTDADAVDYLFFVHDRHDGNLDAARRYLEWETGLVAQCSSDELAAFRLPTAPDSAHPAGPVAPDRPLREPDA